MFYGPMCCDMMSDEQNLITHTTQMSSQCPN